MKDEFKDLELINNSSDRLFEMKLGNQSATIRYSLKDHQINLLHTHVPKNLEGKGAGSAMIEKTLIYIEKNNWKAVPFCPFVIDFIKRHPEWNRIVVQT